MPAHTLKSSFFDQVLSKALHLHLHLAFVYAFMVGSCFHAYIHVNVLLSVCLRKHRQFVYNEVSISRKTKYWPKCREIIEIDSYQDALYQGGVVSPLLALLNGKDGDSNLQILALEILAKLAGSENCREEIV